MSATSTKCTVSFNSKETNEVTPVNYTKTELLALNEEYQNVAYESLKTQLLNDTYPIGSIYISTTDSTVDSVEQRFGGTWVRYATDTTLVGYKEGTNTINATGGAKTTTLSTTNLPTHSHVIPSLSGYTKATTHTSPINNDGDYAITAGGMTSGIVLGEEIGANYASWTISIPSLTVTTNASNTTTCTNCSSTPVNVQDPYTVVYMYKRTA